MAVGVGEISGATARPGDAERAWIRSERGERGLLLTAGGRWDIQSATRLSAALPKPEAADGATAVTVDMAKVEVLDTSGAWLLRRTMDGFRKQGLEVEVTGARPAFEALLDDVGRPDPAVQIEAPMPPKLVEIANRVGESTYEIAAEARDLIGFFGLLLSKSVGVILRPSRLRFTSTVYHMEQVGLNALPIVALLSFLIGIVLAYQGAEQLRQFGAELFVVNLLGISILRELGILITAIIIAGRSGSSFTAQIGTMKVNEEVDAMQTIGIDPVEILVLPRVAALVLTLPLLAFLSDVVGLAGGALMSYFVLDITFGQFLKQLQTAVGLEQLWIGLVKAPVFAFAIAMIGCYEGLKVSGSAESVGKMTTKSVVESIFLVIVLDAIFSIIFVNLGL